MNAAKSNVAEVKAMLTEMAAEAQHLEQAAGGSITDTDRNSGISICGVNSNERGQIQCGRGQGDADRNGGGGAAFGTSRRRFHHRYRSEFWNQHLRGKFK